MKVKKTSVKGFYFAGLHCGIKELKEKKDLALFYSIVPATVAGVFTNNTLKAAPVKLCQKHLAKKKAQVVVVNSGCANAGTGKKGEKDALKMAREAARHFDTPLHHVFICSTGVIGRFLPITKILKGIADAKVHLHPENIDLAAEAICTTDAHPKCVYYEGNLGQRNFSVAVIAKGAGMIHPNMATLLCFIVTDLNIPQRVLQRLLNESVDPTLNALSVDGETSTNDTVLMLANGLAENAPLKVQTPQYIKVKGILTSLLKSLTVKIALDGEGATKCFEVNVIGAKSKKAALAFAQSVAKSQLVKTAIFGCDPNWGRVYSALGQTGLTVREDKLAISFGPYKLFQKGKVLFRNQEKAKDYLKENQVVEIQVQLFSGEGQAKMIASDLSYDYIKLNAEYTT